MKTLKYIALAALTISLAACMQDEDFIPQGDIDAVKITANIGKLQTRVSYDGKGNTEFDKGDQIRVKNTLRTSKNIATYNLTDEGWNTADAFVWNGGTSKNQFEAWYPVGDYSSFSTFELPTDQSEGIEAADWMTIGTNEMEKPSNKTLNLNFYHMLTKVTVNITNWGSEYDGTAKSIENVKIYSLATDIVQNREKCVGEINTASLTAIDPLTHGNSYTAIVCPGLYTTDQKFMTFTVNGTDYLTVLAKLPSPIELTSAMHYTFNLTVGKNAAVISSVSVTDWSEKDVDGGVAEELIPNPIDATTMSTNALNTAVAEELARGIRNLEVTLAPDAPAEMITAIRRALIDTEGVADGSINLTLKGVTTIPDHHEFEGEGSSIFGQVQKKDDTVEEVTQLASVNLPDVLTIGDVAFLYCGNLTTVTAPKVQTIGLYAFYGTVLTSVNLPEATAIDESAFSWCSDIKEFNLPKVTVLGAEALDIARTNGEVTIYLTSADEIVVHKGCFYTLADSGRLETQVNLVLNGNKQSEVNGNTWTTKDADGNEVSFTFKSITFVGE